MDYRGLAGSVGIGLHRVDEDAVDRGDVDDLGGLVGGRGGAQRFCQRLGQEEQRLDIEVHHLVPAALREFVELRAPGSTRIVDQDVELRLQLDDFAGELVAA